MFEGFFSELQSSSTSALTGSQKLTLLLHHISTPIYKCLSRCQNDNAAISTLDGMFIKKKNSIFARYLLATRRQETEESLELYLQNLKILSRDCDFTAWTASQARDIALRDAFISGVRSNQIRQRMLKNKDLDLATTYELTLTLDMAQKQSDLYSQPDFSGATIPAQPHSQQIPISNSQHCDLQNKDSSNTIEQPITIAAAKIKCYFCSLCKHTCSSCPAWNSRCHRCGKQGHFLKVCWSTPSQKIHLAATISLSTVSPKCLSKTIVPARVNGLNLHALIDTGSSENFIDAHIVETNKWKIFSCSNQISMATLSLFCRVIGYCIVTLELKENFYSKIKLLVMRNLCREVVLGHNFLNQHFHLTILFGGTKPALQICGLATAKVQYPSLFSNLTSDCKPIDVKSRRYSLKDKEFIAMEVKRHLKENIIEPSKSPWRAQVLIMTN